MDLAHLDLGSSAADLGGAGASAWPPPSIAARSPSSPGGSASTETNHHHHHHHQRWSGPSPRSSCPPSAIQSPLAVNHPLYASDTAAPDAAKQSLVTRSHSDGAIAPEAGLLAAHRASFPALQGHHGLSGLEHSALTAAHDSGDRSRKTSDAATTGRYDLEKHPRVLSDSEASTEWHANGFQTPPTPGDGRPLVIDRVPSMAEMTDTTPRYLTGGAPSGSVSSSSFAYGLAPPGDCESLTAPTIGTSMLLAPSSHSLLAENNQHDESAHHHHIPRLTRRVSAEAPHTAAPDLTYAQHQPPHYPNGDHYGYASSFVPREVDHRFGNLLIAAPPAASTSSAPPSRPSSTEQDQHLEPQQQHRQAHPVWNSVPVPRDGSPSVRHDGRLADLMPRQSLTELQPRHMAQLTGVDRHQKEAFLAPYIRQYLNSHNRFLLGERTVIVLSGKVAQKSYGTEKRFLCPPPSALLLGCSWWSASPSDVEPLMLDPPAAVISMVGERGPPNEAYSEWMTMAGRVAGSRASLNDPAIAGRCVGKQLHISEVDEKTKRVKALVRVFAPGFGPPDTRLIGTFPSKPIKVISKPSKKRQSVKNVDLCIHHGSTISLFNRLRSQTVSTKYLCISGQPASFPASDWRAMSGQEEKPFAQSEESACFVARTSAWDPFIVYLVDPNSTNTVPHMPPMPGYPRPPTNALPVPTRGGQVPIFFNQPVVFQCLSTGVVSPVMIIRRVEKGSMAYGGSSGEPFSPAAPGSNPVAPGEVVGDMVCSLNKVALEVVSDPQAAYSSPTASALQGFPGCGSFLACLGENVGINAAQTSRQPIGDTASPLSAGASSSRSSISSTADALAEAVSLASPKTAGSRSTGRTSPPSVGEPEGDASCNGGKDKRYPRRNAGPDPMGRGGRVRSGAHPSLLLEGGSPDDGVETSPPLPMWSTAQPRAWQIECGEPAVWTIVGCDIDRHTFYVPPNLMHGTASSPVVQGSVPDVFTTPIPSVPIGFGGPTPIPSLQRALPAGMGSSKMRDCPPSDWITIYGSDLSPHMWVWFHDVPSPNVEFKTPEVMMAQLPARPQGQSSSTQIILVRDDGVVFPSQVFHTF